MLGAVDQQHLGRANRQAAPQQMARHRLAVARSPAMRLVMQQGLQVAAAGQLPQHAPQQLRLAGAAPDS